MGDSKPPDREPEMSLTLLQGIGFELEEDGSEARPSRRRWVVGAYSIRYSFHTWSLISDVWSAHREYEEYIREEGRPTYSPFSLTKAQVFWQDTGAKFLQAVPPFHSSCRSEERQVPLHNASTFAYSTVSNPFDIRHRLLF